MMDLEERVGAALHTAAESVARTPLDPTLPQALTRRRRRTRRAGRAMAALVALIGLGAVVQLTAGNSLTLQTADEDGVDEEGIPVDTGPELEWSQVDGAADLQLREIVWTGERFLALGGERRGALYASSDGEVWESVSTGETNDLSFAGVAAGDGRVAAWGRSGDESHGPNRESTAPTVLVSDDHGANWRDLGQIGTPLVDDDPSDYVLDDNFVGSMAIAGDTIMVVQVSHPWLDVEQVLIDRGLLQPDDELVLAEVMWQSNGEASAKYCLNPPEGICGDDTQNVEFVAKALEEAMMDESSTVWISTSDGPFEPVTQFENEAAKLASAQGRFLMTTFGDGGQLLASDDDGLTWQPVTLDRTANEPTPNEGELRSGPWRLDLAADGTDLVVVANIDGRAESRRSSDGGQTWTTTTVAAIADTIALGPGGQVLTATVPTEDQGAVRTFLDWLAELRGTDTSPPGVIGWSPDGENWGWQSQEEAFGSKGWTNIAVGDTKVVAVVYPEYELDGQPEPSAPAVFVADIPS